MARDIDFDFDDSTPKPKPEPKPKPPRPPRTYTSPYDMRGYNMPGRTCGYGHTWSTVAGIRRCVDCGKTETVVSVPAPIAPLAPSCVVAGHSWTIAAGEPQKRRCTKCDRLEVLPNYASFPPDPPKQFTPLNNTQASAAVEADVLARQRRRRIFEEAARLGAVGVLMFFEDPGNPVSIMLSRMDIEVIRDESFQAYDDFGFGFNPLKKVVGGPPYAVRIGFELDDFVNLMLPRFFKTNTQAEVLTPQGAYMGHARLDSYGPVSGDFMGLPQKPRGRGEMTMFTGATFTTY
jgi:hypothetical protein